MNAKNTKIFFFTIILCTIFTFNTRAQSWNQTNRATHTTNTINSNQNFTVALWVKLQGFSSAHPALISNKVWENGKPVDLITIRSLGKTRSTGTDQGWTIGLQQNGSWFLNLGNGDTTNKLNRLDYMPTAKHQPINDNKWHLLAFSINHKKKIARIYYDGKNVAIYYLNTRFRNGSMANKLGASAPIITGADRPGNLPPIPGLDAQFTKPHTTQSILTDDQIFNLYKQKFPNARQPDLSKPVDQLKVLSWNIWFGARQNGTEKGITQVVNFIKSTSADIITMQETYGSGAIIADRLGYYFYLRSDNLSVMSKYPITKTHNLYSGLYFGGATIKLSNTQNINAFSLWISHLPAWGRNYRAKNATAQKLIAGEWTSRAKQLSSILNILKPYIKNSDKTPLIIGGDFNSPSTLDWTPATKHWHNNLAVEWPASKVIIEKGFTDTFRAIHKTPLTFKPKHNQWPSDANSISHRIDYIYTLGKKLNTQDSTMFNIHNNTWPSDHPAVLSTLKLTTP